MINFAHVACKVNFPMTFIAIFLVDIMKFLWFCMYPNVGIRNGI